MESKRDWDGCSWGINIQLPDIDEDIGHTLVHFLYTGEYQTLSPLTVLDNAIEYKRSIRLYCVARGYELDDLVSHAKIKMRELIEGLPIFSILDIAIEMLPKLLPDETWFFECIQDMILEAFKKEQGLFTDERFLDCMGKDVAFDKFLVKSIVKVYTSNISGVARKEEEPSSTIPQPASMVESADVPEAENVAALEPTPKIELDPIGKEPMSEPEPIEKTLLSQEAGPGPVSIPEPAAPESIPEPAAPESMMKSASESDPKPTPELDSECGLSIEKAAIQELVPASQPSFGHWAGGSELSQIEIQKPVNERPQNPKPVYRRLVVPPSAIFTHPGIIQLEDSSEDEKEEGCKLLGNKSTSYSNFLTVCPNFRRSRSIRCQTNRRYLRRNAASTREVRS